mgnify:FL=1
MKESFYKKFTRTRTLIILLAIIVLAFGANKLISVKQIEIPIKKITEQAVKDKESSSVIPVSNPQASQRPILKNLGVNIDIWNRQTNLAGDLIFDRRLIYDDGRVAGNKVFLDFGMKDKYRVNDVGAIEYWFYVPLGTRVRAPIDGTVQVVFFEHTKDWGVNMIPKESRWIVSFEHLVNLNVKEVYIVSAGDVV